MCAQMRMVNLDEKDFEILGSGEASFIWKSPLAISAKNAVSMARWAVLKMPPAPGRMILTGVIFFMADTEACLEEMEVIVNALRPISCEDGNVLCSVDFCPEKEIRVWIAISEGRMDKEECKLW